MRHHLSQIPSRHLANQGLLKGLCVNRICGLYAMPNVFPSSSMEPYILFLAMLSNDVLWVIATALGRRRARCRRAMGVHLAKQAEMLFVFHSSLT